MDGGPSSKRLAPQNRAAVNLMVSKRGKIILYRAGSWFRWIWWGDMGLAQKMFAIGRSPIWEILEGLYKHVSHIKPGNTTLKIYTTEGKNQHSTLCQILVLYILCFPYIYTLVPTLGSGGPQ